jgi:hypothetical protein
MIAMQPREKIAENGVCSGSKMQPVVNLKTCRSCYQQLPDKLCACREKIDIIRRGCPDWYPKDKKTK